MLRTLILFGLLVLIACAPLRPSYWQNKVGEEPTVLIKSARLPDTEVWYSRFAHHTWMDVRLQQGGPWMRLEIKNPKSGATVKGITAKKAFGDERWGRKVEVRRAFHGDWVGPVAIEAIRSTRWKEKSSYRPYPGPNSNTFLESLLKEAPGLSATMHPNAIGKDFRGHVGLSETGAGVELDAWVIGLQAGWREGIEVHAAGLTVGVGLWPPSLKLPLFPEWRAGF